MAGSDETRWMTRREALATVGGAAALALVGCKPGDGDARPSKVVVPGGAAAAPGAPTSPRPAEAAPAAERVDPVLGTRPLGRIWPTEDPFLFCVHHDDDYPAGDARLAPAASLAGRNLGNDFQARDGWRMYHGRVIPGFPKHPHRGFETVTFTRRGYVDHADSLGATARYGEGDVQWMTAGRGISHAEMFPLIEQSRRNPLDFFQIWINLPARDKMVEPHFSMLWREQIPTVTATDDAGRQTVITVAAGALGETRPPAPPPHSWASRQDAHVAIWRITMAPGARWTLPAGPAQARRTLYVYRGPGVHLGPRAIASGTSASVHPDAAIAIANGTAASELLLLQGRPIGEPVAKRGPFVMNTDAEIQQAYADYRSTRFGGWPWADDAPVHARDSGRFARHADGRLERARG